MLTSIAIRCRRLEPIDINGGDKRTEITLSTRTGVMFFVLPKHATCPTSGRKEKKKTGSRDAVEYEYEASNEIPPTKYCCGSSLANFLTISLTPSFGRPNLLSCSGISA
jgi:hypothetical protein